MGWCRSVGWCVCPVDQIHEVCWDAVCSLEGCCGCYSLFCAVYRQAGQVVGSVTGVPAVCGMASGRESAAGL